jgi:hypothetical protein
MVWLLCWKSYGYSCVNLFWDFSFVFHQSACLFWCHYHSVFVTMAL